MVIGNDIYKSDAKTEYADKNRNMRPYFSISREHNVVRTIDKFDHEANSMGCKIFNYDYYERQRKIDIMLLIGTLGLYFIIGVLLGIAITI